MFCRVRDDSWLFVCHVVHFLFILNIVFVFSPCQSAEFDLRRDLGSRLVFLILEPGVCVRVCFTSGSRCPRLMHHQRAREGVVF